jgi:hypothetical protein
MYSNEERLSKRIPPLWSATILMHGLVELSVNSVSDNAFFIAHERDIDSLLVIVAFTDLDDG